MNSFRMFKIIISIIFLLLINHYSSAQTRWNKETLINKWKLTSIVLLQGWPHSIMDTLQNGKPHYKMDTLQNEVITFKSDSICERLIDKDKLEGLWYIDAQGFLIIKFTKVNEKQYDLNRSVTTFWKIKELNSQHLVLIFLEREGNDAIHTYNSYLEN